MTKCTQPHYAVIVESTKDVEIYQFGDDDCLDCMRSLVKKHEAVIVVLRDKLAELSKRAPS